MWRRRWTNSGSDARRWGPNRERRIAIGRKAPCSPPTASRRCTTPVRCAWRNKVGAAIPEIFPPRWSSSSTKSALLKGAFSETKSWWLRTRQKAGPDLRAALDEVTLLIDRLAGYVREAELTAAASRQALTPELDAAVRGVQMRRAYAGAQASFIRRSHQ